MGRTVGRTDVGAAVRARDSLFLLPCSLADFCLARRRERSVSARFSGTRSLLFMGSQVPEAVFRPEEFSRTFARGKNALAVKRRWLQFTAKKEATKQSTVLTSIPLRQDGGLAGVATVQDS